MAHALRDILRKKGTADLIWLLDTSEPELQIKIAHELGRRGSHEAVGPLRRRLQFPNAGLREAAAEALGSIGDTSSGSDILRLFADVDQPTAVRDTSAFALARLAYAPALPELVKALADPSPTVRICAVSALVAIGAPEGIQHVEITSLIEQDERVKQAVRTALEWIRRHGAAVIITGDVPILAITEMMTNAPDAFLPATPSIGLHVPRRHFHLSQVPTQGTNSSLRVLPPIPHAFDVPSILLARPRTSRQSLSWMPPDDE